VATDHHPEEYRVRNHDCHEPRVEVERTGDIRRGAPLVVGPDLKPLKAGMSVVIGACSRVLGVLEILFRAHDHGPGGYP
jgi:hypothetical protein